MKTIKNYALLAVFLFCMAGLAHAVDAEDIESPELIDRLLSLRVPQAPVLFEDVVIFTASSQLRRVGIAFSEEGFAKVHWFRPLYFALDPRDIPANEKNPSLHGDSGVVFYIYQIPEETREIAYRLIIDGLWTTDPANPHSRRDHFSGLALSTISVPYREIAHNHLKGPPGSLSFNFKGPPGETVSVAGDFNGWDPFMYELREHPAGTYTLNINLPPGKYQYVFFHRGRRYLDPYNGRRVYTRDGQAASEIVIQ